MATKNLSQLYTELYDEYTALQEENTRLKAGTIIPTAYEFANDFNTTADAMSKRSADGWEIVHITHNDVLPAVGKSLNNVVQTSATGKTHVTWRRPARPAPVPTPPPAERIRQEAENNLQVFENALTEETAPAPENAPAPTAEYDAVSVKEVSENWSKYCTRAYIKKGKRYIAVVNIAPHPGTIDEYRVHSNSILRYDLLVANQKLYIRKYDEAQRTLESFLQIGTATTDEIHATPTGLVMQRKPGNLLPTIDPAATFALTSDIFQVAN